ncbi:cation:dicarboxylate symporter family transporter [Synechococcus sp. LA31]|uniref:cation:dicarboxylate symporter family transporter n=1 Tax=Synechococcus sp. LA31 TaxID=2741953 RepID=UPI001BDD2280|nr:cation:dicarboxylase symporter family transporter [Synechococcus sp. LA31]QVV67018.1 cation:dicarboxylase symporter family transporter [Synechococcus sp. LA31]
MRRLLRMLLAPLRLFLRQSLAVQVLEGLVAGLVLGFWLPAAVVQSLRPVGDGFLRLFQMPVLPFLSLSLIAGVGRLELHQAGRLLSRSALVLLLLWGLALVAVLLLPLGFPAWQDASLFRPSLLEPPKPLNLLELFIPVNPFEAFATAQIPAVVLFSLCLGMALISVPAREGLIAGLDRLSAALLKISAVVAQFTPLGVFAILAGAASSLSPAEVPRLGIYLVLQGGLVLLLALVVLPLLISAITPISIRQLLRCFRTPLIIAFATANLFVVLPLLVERGKELIVQARAERQGVRCDQEQAMAAIRRDVELPVEVLTPLALVFPDMGRLLSLGFVPFAGWLSGNPLPPSGLPEFLITGLASTFLEGVMAMTFLLNRLGMPADLVQLYVAMDQLAVARLGTLLACMSVISLVLLSTWLSLESPRTCLRRLLRPGLALLSLPLFVGGARLSFDRLPTPGNPLRQQLESQRFARAKGAATLLDAAAPALPQAGRWAAIRQRGTIRYCTQLHDYPMAFVNQRRALVGADVELGLLFAEQMGLEARFLPVTNSQDPEYGVSSADRALMEQRCDMTIALRAPAPERGADLQFSDLQEVFGVSLLLHSERLRDQRSWQDLRQQEGLRLGLPTTSPFLLQWARQLLPRATLYPQQPLEALVQSLRRGEVDAVLLSAQKGSAWTVLEPDLSLLVPQPALSLPAARAFPQKGESLRHVWELWMQYARADGLRDQVFRHWVEGLAN